MNEGWILALKSHTFTKSNWREQRSLRGDKVIVREKTKTFWIQDISCVLILRIGDGGGWGGGSWWCATAPRCMPGYVRCALVYKKIVARHFSLTDITHLNRKQVDPGVSRASSEGVQNDATRTECCLWRSRCRPDRSPFGLCTVTVRRTGAVSHWEKRKKKLRLVVI